MGDYTYFSYGQVEYVLKPYYYNVMKGSLKDIRRLNGCIYWRWTGNQVTFYREFLA